MDITRVHPLDRDDTLDALDAHYTALERPRPHGCYDGLVYIGHMLEEDGEEVEVIEAVPCRRCSDSS